MNIYEYKFDMNGTTHDAAIISHEKIKTQLEKNLEICKKFKKNQIVKYTKKAEEHFNEKGIIGVVYRTTKDGWVSVKRKDNNKSGLYDPSFWE